MKKFVLDFTAVVFLLIFPFNAFASYSCETKATDLAKIQSEIDGLNAQKTTLENWLTNTKNWLTFLVKNKKAITKVEGKSSRYKSEIVELQTQIDGLQFKINELQSAYNELNEVACEEPCNLSFGGMWFTDSTSAYTYLTQPVSIESNCEWTVTTSTGGWDCNGILYMGWWKTGCGGWKIVEGNYWIHPQTTGGTGSGEVIYSIDSPDTLDCRTGYINVIASDGQTASFQIVQDGLRRTCR